jgi:hypothetical protein
MASESAWTSVFELSSVCRAIHLQQRGITQACVLSSTVGPVVGTGDGAIKCLLNVNDLRVRTVSQTNVEIAQANAVAFADSSASLTRPLAASATSALALALGLGHTKLVNAVLGV